MMLLLWSQEKKRTFAFTYTKCCKWKIHRIPKTKKRKIKIHWHSLTLITFRPLSKCHSFNIMPSSGLIYVSWFQNINSICIMILGAYFLRSLACHLIQLKTWNPFVEFVSDIFFLQIHKCSMIRDWILKLSHYQCLTLTNTPPTWRKIRKKSWIEITRFQSFLCMNTEHSKLFYYHQTAIHVDQNCVMFLCHLPSKHR